MSYNLDDTMDEMNEDKYLSKINKFADIFRLQAMACERLLGNNVEEAVALAGKAKQLADTLDTTDTTIDDILGGND